MSTSCPEVLKKPRVMYGSLKNFPKWKNWKLIESGAEVAGRGAIP